MATNFRWNCSDRFDWSTKSIMSIHESFNRVRHEIVYSQRGGSRILAESFNDWGGRGRRKFVPVLGGDGTKIAPPGDIFDQPPGEMR